MANLDDQIQLCCLLWAHLGQEAGLTAYEDRVLALVPEHGGSVLQRAVSDGAAGRPHEVQAGTSVLLHSDRPHAYACKGTRSVRFTMAVMEPHAVRR